LNEIDCRSRTTNNQPHLTFTVSVRSNDLTYLQEYSKRQEIIFSLISYLHHERSMSYRQITKWLNSSGIKTHRNKIWGETGNSVYSVLKRFRQRQQRIHTVRNRQYKTSMSNFKVKYI